MKQITITFTAVSEKMPPVNEMVFISDGSRVGIGRYTGIRNYWITDYSRSGLEINVVEWAELPKRFGDTIGTADIVTRINPADTGVSADEALENFTKFSELLFGE